MTIEEWAKDFKSYVAELQLFRDDYKGIIKYIDEGLALLKEQGGCENCAISIEDRQPVVRCRYCINCVKEPNGELYCDILSVGYEPLGSKKVNGDWFCADGERKD